MLLYASGTQRSACLDLSRPSWCCRFYQAEDWTAKKLECLVDPPDTLHLEGLRSSGPQPGEQMQPQEDEPSQPAGRQLLGCWDQEDERSQPAGGLLLESWDQEDEQLQPAGGLLLESWDHHLVQREMGTSHGAAQPAGRQLKHSL